MTTQINGKIPLSVSGKDKLLLLKALKPFRRVGSFKDHKLDRVVFEKNEVTDQLMKRCSEYLHANDESFIASPSISSFSVDTGSNYVYDYHSLAYLENAVGERSGYDSGFMYQVFDPRRGDYCVCAGIIGHVKSDDRWKALTSVIYVDDYYATLMDESDLEAFSNQAGSFFFATQFVMRTRPTELKERIERTQYRIHAPGTKEHRRRVVQMVRTIYIDTAVLAAPVERMTTERKIECPCWGVMGHWRTYKNGKRVWIKPYRKGKERNDPTKYSSKDYKNKEISL